VSGTLILGDLGETLDESSPNFGVFIEMSMALIGLMEPFLDESA